MKTQRIKKSILYKATKNSYPFGSFLTAIAFFLLSLAGYSQVGSTTSALLGNTSYADDCSPEYQAFNEKMMMFGRIAVSSRAFEQCVNEKVRALYKKCKNDPFYDASIDVQIQKVIAVARSINNVHIKCTGGAGNASAGIDDYGKISDEAFSWGGWFSDVYAQLDKRKCNLGRKYQTRIIADMMSIHGHILKEQVLFGMRPCINMAMGMVTILITNSL